MEYKLLLDKLGIHQIVYVVLNLNKFTDMKHIFFVLI